MITLALLLLVQAGARRPQHADPPPPLIPVQLGTSVRPETVTVGDPFHLAVRVRAPRGARITFPAAPDSGGAIAALDPRTVRPSADTTAVDQTASYRLVAWDVESQPITLGDVVVRVGDRERRIPLAGLRVYVKSVLPADSAKRVPKPPRDIFEFGMPWWQWLLLALLAAAIIGLLYWLWWRRRRRKDEPVDPYAHALAELERIEAMRLVDAGERGRHVALMVEVLRDYLARTVEQASLSLTTIELLAALRGNAHVPINQLSPLLAEADLVKFARRSVSTDRARKMGQEARAIVVATHAALTAPAEEQRKAA